MLVPKKITMANNWAFSGIKYTVEYFNFKIHFSVKVAEGSSDTSRSVK